MYDPSFTVSTLASAPSILTAFTVSFKDPKDMYPMAALFSATVVIITDVEFVICTLDVVLSTLFPSLSFCSIPNNSMKAPLVPDPSSLDTAVIFSSDAAFLSSLELPPHPVKRLDAATVATANVNNFFLIVLSLLLNFVFVSITNIMLLGKCKIKKKSCVKFLLNVKF